MKILSLSLTTFLILFTANIANAADTPFSNANTYAARKKKTTWKAKKRRKISPIGVNRVSGIVILNYFGSGFGVGYSRKPTNFFEYGGSATYTRAHLEGTVGNQVSEILDSTTQRLAASAKVSAKFVHFGANLNISQISGDFSIEDSNPGQAQIVDVPFKSLVIHPDVFIGTNWNLKNNFFLSLDWVGSSIPLSSSLNTTSTEAKDLAVEFLTGQGPNERVTEEIKNQLSLYYGLLHFGYRF